MTMNDNKGQDELIYLKPVLGIFSTALAPTSNLPNLEMNRVISPHFAPLWWSQSGREPVTYRVAATVVLYKGFVMFYNSPCFRRHFDTIFNSEDVIGQL